MRTISKFRFGSPLMVSGALLALAPALLEAGGYRRSLHRSVNVHRKVLENGKVIRQDNFFTRYTPQNPTAVYGPGATPPGPYFTLPG